MSPNGATDSFRSPRWGSKYLAVPSRGFVRLRLTSPLAINGRTFGAQTRMPLRRHASFFHIAGGHVQQHFDGCYEPVGSSAVDQLAARTRHRPTLGLIDLYVLGSLDVDR